MLLRTDTISAETDMAIAFRAAGYQTPREQLREAAVNAWRAHPNSYNAALQHFRDAVRPKDMLALALIAEVPQLAEAWKFASSSIFQGIRNEALAEQARANGLDGVGGLKEHDTQFSRAPAPSEANWILDQASRGAQFVQNNGGEGRTRHDSQASNAFSPEERARLAAEIRARNTPSPEELERRQEQQMQARLRTISRFIADTEIVNGKPLRKATKAEIIAWGDEAKKSGHRRYIFSLSVTSGMNSGDVLEEKLTNDEIQHIWERSGRESAA